MSPAGRRHFARVTIEFTAPFLVASGEGDDHRDALPVVDVHGLPVIPGSSIAGVLRHAMQRLHPSDDAVSALFGSRPDEHDPDGGGSRLWVSWAHVHDRDDRAMDGLRLDAVLPSGDPVLAAARRPSTRDHVRIGTRGSADERGKFDECLLPSGLRFTFDLVAHDAAEGVFDEVLGLLASGRLRLGRGSGRGLGSFRVARVQRATFDLRDRAQSDAFLALPRRVSEPVPRLAPSTPTPQAPVGEHIVELDLEAVEPWLVSCHNPKGRGGDRDEPDAVPVTMARVEWDPHGKGSVGAPQAYVPGSAVRGCLAHRTAFHARASSRVFASCDGAGTESPSSAAPAEVDALFGFVRGGSSRAGRLRFEDAWLAPRPRELDVDHNGIDRFTGGTLPGVLFRERVFLPGSSLRLRFSVRDLASLRSAAPRALLALTKAIRDLESGRLQLGAGSGRGQGRFRCRQPSRLPWEGAGAR